MKSSPTWPATPPWALLAVQNPDRLYHQRHQQGQHTCQDHEQPYGHHSHVHLHDHPMSSPMSTPMTSSHALAALLSNRQRAGPVSAEADGTSPRPCRGSGEVGEVVNFHSKTTSFILVFAGVRTVLGISRCSVNVCWRKKMNKRACVNHKRHWISDCDFSSTGWADRWS